MGGKKELRKLRLHPLFADFRQIGGDGLDRSVGTLLDLKTQLG